MRRTQLYLDDPLWDALHARARSQRTTISELVRQAVRDRYLGNQEQRRIAMQCFVGTRRSAVRTETFVEVRSLRRGSRLDKLGAR